MRTFMFLLFAALAQAACTGGDTPLEASDAGPRQDGSQADAGANYADGDWLFEPDLVLEVRPVPKGQPRKRSRIAQQPSQSKVRVSLMSLFARRDSSVR